MTLLQVSITPLKNFSFFDGYPKTAIFYGILFGYFDKWFWTL